MERSPRRDKGEEEFAFQRKVSRGQTPTPPKFNRCQLMVGDRLMAGITMALPFVVCFTTFGIFNLIAGSILTSMAWKPTNVTWDSQVEIPKPRDKFERFKREKFLDPLKVMGPILLITGIMLVLVGFALGLTACRSVYASRDPSKSSMITHYTAAIQLSGFNGANSCGGNPWMGGPGKNATSDASRVTDVEHENKMKTPTTEVTIEMATPAATVKTFNDTNREDGDDKSGSGSSGSSRGEESPFRNKVDKRDFSALESTPGCSYYEGQGLVSTFRPHLFCRGGGGGQRSDSAGRWDSDSSFLVPPYDLNPETYIT